jgi:hypothetical protein
MKKADKKSSHLIMELISKNMTAFAATQWLKAPNPNLNHKTPSELMSEGSSDNVYRELQKEFKNKNGKC